MGAGPFGLAVQPSIYSVMVNELTFDDTLSSGVLALQVTVPDGTVVTGGGYDLSLSAADGSPMNPSFIGGFSVSKNGPMFNNYDVATGWQFEAFSDDSQWLRSVIGTGCTATLRVWACIGQTWSYGSR